MASEAMSVALSGLGLFCSVVQGLHAPRLPLATFLRPLRGTQRRAERGASAPQSSAA